MEMGSARSVDFSNAYPTMSQLTKGVLVAFMLPAPQGDPLSPAIYSLVSPLVIYPLLSCVKGLEVLMYADDLIVFFPFDYLLGALDTVLEILREFGEFSGLKINCKKTAAIVCNQRASPWVDAYRRVGIEVRHWVRYLGIRLGNLPSTCQRTYTECGITLDQVYAPALHECLRRVRIVSSLPLH